MINDNRRCLDLVPVRRFPAIVTEVEYEASCGFNLPRNGLSNPNEDCQKDDPDAALFQVITHSDSEWDARVNVAETKIDESMQKCSKPITPPYTGGIKVKRAIIVMDLVHAAISAQNLTAPLVPRPLGNKIKDALNSTPGEVDM